MEELLKAKALDVTRSGASATVAILEEAKNKDGIKTKKDVFKDFDLDY